MVDTPDAMKSLTSMLPDQFEGLLSKASAASDPEYKKISEAEKQFAKTKGELGVQKAEAEAKYAKAGVGGEQAVYKKFEKQLMEPAPTIQYNEETSKSMASLATLLPVAAMMFGNKSQLSAIGAMNAMSGVLEGHQQGNKERIALETKNFEQKMNEFKTHQEQIKGAFERALQAAKLNASAAQAGLKVDLAKLDAQLLNAEVDQKGVTRASMDNLDRINKVTNAVEQSLIKLNAEKPDNYTVNGQPRFILPSEALAMERAGATVVGSGKATAPKTAQITDETANFVADSYLSNPAAASSLFSRMSTADKDKVLEAVAKKATEQGKTPEDLNRIRLQFVADTSAARTFGTQEAKVSAASQTAANSIAIAKDYSEKLPRGNFQTVNSLLQKADTEISDPTLLGFKKALDTLAIEYARATSPVGQPTDYKLKVAQNALSTITSKEAFDEVISVMEREIAASQAAQKTGLEAILGGKGKPSASAPAAAEDPLGLRTP